MGAGVPVRKLEHSRRYEAAGLAWSIKGLNIFFLKMQLFDWVGCERKGGAKGAEISHLDISKERTR